MRFDDEIVRAIKHQAATDTFNSKTDDELKTIEKAVRIAVYSSNYDFSKSESIVLNQSGGKKRFVKQYSDIFSPESILCQCIKQILDRTFKIKYPNRNKSIRALFDALKAIKQMADFTIIKYDFKNYFNSVSVPYVYEKYLKSRLTDRFEADLIGRFARETKYAYAGFSTSNVIAEIIAQKFDNEIRLAFAGKCILFFERYIDDSIIIINEHVEESECRRLLQDILAKIFHDNSITKLSKKKLPKCKTKFNDSKFVHISRRILTAASNVVDYLGYEFAVNKLENDKVEIKYGITQTKQDKYNGRIDEIISLYKEQSLSNGSSNPDYRNIELLRHRIAAFTSRTVYQSRRFRTTIWKTKGFIGNYSELRYLLETQLIEPATETFLKNMVPDAFKRVSMSCPYFLNGAIGRSGYSLFENMKVNKTLLLVERIGYSRQALERICSQIGISLVDKNGKRRGYGNLVRDYLIKLKVGY
jgi:hypothetical protein